MPGFLLEVMEDTLQLKKKKEYLPMVGCTTKWGWFAQSKQVKLPKILLTKGT